MQFVFQYEIDCLMDIHHIRVVSEQSVLYISWNIVAQVGEQFVLGEDVIQLGRRWNVPISLLGSLGVESVCTQGSL